MGRDTRAENEGGTRKVEGCSLEDEFSQRNPNLPQRQPVPEHAIPILQRTVAQEQKNHI